MKAYFVTATDTDAGKTFATCALLEALKQQGKSCFGLKPIAAGAEDTPEGLRNEDALALMRHASIELEYSQVNPLVLRTAASPHIAAELDQRRPTVDQLLGYLRGTLMKRPDVALIEGAGGWRVPLNNREMVSDLALALGYPVIVVVPMRLGCINHACLTVEAIRRDGAQVAGWIANTLTPEPMAHYQRNIETLSNLLRAPLVAELPFQPERSPSAAIAYIKTQLIA